MVSRHPFASQHRKPCAMGHINSMTIIRQVQQVATGLVASDLRGHHRQLCKKSNDMFRNISQGQFRLVTL